MPLSALRLEEPILVTAQSISHIVTYAQRCISADHDSQALQQVILSVIAVPGALIAGYLVEVPFLGRRGTLAIFTRRPQLLPFTSFVC